MSNMTTLGAVLERVERMSERHTDRLVNVGDIAFDNIETVNIRGEVFPLKPTAQQAVANRLGIPIQYIRRCPSEIQRSNLNYWIALEKNEKLFFRFDRNEVRAVFTPRYQPTDNLEVLDRLVDLGYSMDTQVHASLDDNFMCVNVPDGDKTFSVNGDRMTPGISISNSEVGIAALSIAAFVLRLVCTNGMITKTEVSASYRHVSTKILRDFPDTLNHVGRELASQRNQLQFSLDSRVEKPEQTIESFNRQFLLSKEEKEAVIWATPIEYGQTMFNVINIYTKAAQFPGLTADSSFRLQKVGGQILNMIK